VSILEPGRTCFRIGHATRVSVLVDAAAYFAALREALLHARHNVFIVGWDVDTRTMLVPEAEPKDGYPPQLLSFLNAVLERRPTLTVRVLSWDYSVIYALERERLPAYKFHAQGHPRLCFALDGRHQVGAAHHQKIVTIDDQVAFCGGIDLTIRRWDTSAHAADDPRRTDPQGEPYAPMHDVQLAVEGEVAQLLGELSRQRWQRATGQALPRPPAPASTVALDRMPKLAAPAWPRDLAPDFTDVRVAIARTESSTADNHRDIREILQLTLRAIERAERSIFIENQYLTAAAVGEALAARLHAERGPEIVVVLPKMECGWLEQSSMGVLRERMLRQLQRADRYGRLRVYYPSVPGLADGCVNLHSKVLIVDDWLLKVGSSNLSNRSLGLDTECDLVIEADDGEHGAAVRRAICAVRDRLLAEHLGLSPEEVAARVHAQGSLVAVIEARRGAPRALEPVPLQSDAPLNLAALEQFVVDPERPMAADAFINSLLPPELQKPVPRSLFALVVMLVPLALLSAVWHTPYLSRSPLLVAVGGVLDVARDSSFSALYVVALFVAASLVLCPVTLLVTFCLLAFGPLQGFAYAMLGALVSASFSYVVGRLLGRVPLRYLSGPRMSKLRADLRRRALRATAAARLLPLGNFTAINLLAGALYVPFPAFVLGNLVGLGPGVLGMALFAKQVELALRDPSPSNLALLLLSGLAVGGMLWLLGLILGDSGEGRPRRARFFRRAPQ
jgi:phospholipase D1/2